MNKGYTLYMTEAEFKKDYGNPYNYSSAGPYPSISGMRKLYWGKDAIIVKVGTYIYKVGKVDGNKDNI